MSLALKTKLARARSRKWPAGDILFQFHLRELLKLGQRNRPKTTTTTTPPVIRAPLLQAEFKSASERSQPFASSLPVEMTGCGDVFDFEKRAHKVYSKFARVVRRKKKARSEIRTRITGFKVQGDSHYTNQANSVVKSMCLLIQISKHNLATQTAPMKLASDRLPT